MIFKRTKYTLMALLLAAVGCLALVSPVSAAEDKIHIMVSPTRNRVSLAPGDSYEGTFEVHNIGTEDFTYRVYATPYQVSGEDYSEQDFETSTKYTYMADWITFNRDSGTLSAGDYHTITYTINVPKNAPGGGQYAALMAETDNNEETAVKTISRVGMLLYSSIDGDIIEKGKIIENKIPFFFFKKPITASSLIDNKESNIHGTATYTMRVYPLFSDHEVYSNEDSPDKRTIFPETRRFNTITWDDAPALGIFHVEQEIQFMGQTSTVRKLVIICPLWLIILIIIIIIAIIWWQIARAKARKEIAKEKEEN